MIVVITMAGIGKRFREAGYNCPKYMIVANGKTLFEWSLDSLSDYNQYVTKYIFVARKEDHSRQFIEEKCRLYAIKEIEIVEINHQTDGQATSCLLALNKCNIQESMMVYNIDTYVESGELRYSDISGDGYLPCFHADGEHWSFVKTDEKGKVIEVREKKRISNNCTLGAYYFSSVGLYKKLYNDYYSDVRNVEKGEKYIAPLYNYMIEKGMIVKIGLISYSKVHVLGTPEELEAFIQENSNIKTNAVVQGRAKNQKKDNEEISQGSLK